MLLDHIDEFDFERLPARERKIVEKIAENKTNDEISAALGLPIGTVQNAIRYAMTRTCAKSRIQLAYLFGLWRGKKLVPGNQPHAGSVR